MGMSESAKKARREYMREYRKQNREKQNEYMRDWKKRNPEKVKLNNERYWEKKAGEMLERAEG